MKIKFFGLMLLAVVMVFALASCGGGQQTSASGNKFTIAFDSNGGSEVASIEVDENTAAVAPTAPTKDGYTFVKWQFDGEDWNWNDIVTGNMTLTAVWEEVTYALTFDLDGGELADAPDSYTASGLASLPTPTKTGFDFVAWTLNGTPITAIAAGTTGDLTLVATWEVASDFKLDFEKADQNIHYGETNSSPLAQQLGQTYRDTAGAANGYIENTFVSQLSWQGGGLILEFFKNEKNWHELVTEGGNRFYRNTIDTAMAQKYVDIAGGAEKYNVSAIVYYTNDSVKNAAYNTLTFTFDYRQANAGAFDIHFYLRGDAGKSDRNQDRVNLFTITPEGKVMINYDSNKSGERNCYHDYTDWIAAKEIGAITIGEWNSFKVVLTEIDGGLEVAIYLGNTLLEGELYLKNATHDLTVADAERGTTQIYNRFMMFGGGTGVVAGVEGIAGGYSNSYDLDNIKVNGSVVD